MTSLVDIETRAKKYAEARELVASKFDTDAWLHRVP